MPENEMQNEEIPEVVQEEVEAVSVTEPAAAEESLSAGEASVLGKVPAVGWLAIAVAALVVGLLVGAFALGSGGAAGSLSGKTSVPEGELNSAIGSYTYNGKTTDISVREVILQQTSLEAAKDADGNYTIPSADAVMSVARNMIILAEAQSRGVTATDEEVAAYATEALGTSDYASLAANYSMDESSVVQLLTNSCVMDKLREQVSGEEEEAVLPDAPPAPASQAGQGATAADVDEDTDQEDASQEANAQYAAYIIGLAGDEWDQAAGTWASTDGPYARALAGYEVSNDSATYEAATQAYYVAYELYSEKASATGDAWTDFVNGLLSKATITVYTLLA